MASEDQSREETLTPAQRRFLEESESALGDRTIGWLIEKWGDNKACPYCDSRHWSITRPVTLPLSRDSAEALPVIPVSCDNCGNTVLVNPLASGMLDEVDET